MNMLKVFEVGDEIYGYCNGYFGRDDYEDKVCVMVTKKSAVFEYEDGTLTSLNYFACLEDMVFNWKVRGDEE